MKTKKQHLRESFGNGLLGFHPSDFQCTMIHIAMHEYAEEHTKAFVVYFKNMLQISKSLGIPGGIDPELVLEEFKESLKIANENTEK